MTQRNISQRQLEALSRTLKDAFQRRRIDDTGVVTEIIRDRITDASGQVLEGGKVRKVRFSASGLDDQVVNIPDGTSISVGDAIQVNRSTDRTIRPDWEFKRVIRTTSALGSIQDADRHVSTPIGLQVSTAGTYLPVPGGLTFAFVELTWTANPAHEGVAHYIIAYRKNGNTIWFEIIDDEPSLRINELEVDTTYDFRIRAVNGHGVASTWSSVISYTTTGDTTQPKPVGGSEGDAIINLTADFTSENLVLTWDEIDLDDNDFSHYEIEIYDDSGLGTQYRAITRRANSYTYTLGDNYNDTSGSPDPTLYVRVRAVDYSGNTNAWATVSATNAAPGAVTSLAGAWDKQDLKITWTPPTDPDLSYFLISIYDDNTKVTKYRDFILSTSALATDDARYTYRADDNVEDTGNNTPDTTLYVEVIAYDQFQQASSAATLTSNKTAPGVTVGTVSTDFTDRDLFISFVGVTDPNLDRYKIVLNSSFTYYTRANVFAYVYDKNVGDNGSPGDPTIDYSITWLNKHGQESAAETGTATNAAPSTPANPSATGAFEVINVTWDDVSDDDLKAYNLYASQSSGFTPGVGNLVFTGRSTEFSHSVGYSETWYYKLAARDVFDQLSSFTSEFSATSHDIDTNTPGAPTNLALSSTIEEIYSGIHKGVIYASWDAPVGNPAAFQYELRWKISTESNYEYKKTAVETVNDSIHNLDPGLTYDVNVRSLSRYGKASAWYNSGVDEQITITNDAVAPLAGYTGHHNEKGDDLANFGDATATQWRAQGFQSSVATTIRVVRLRLRKVGTPSDNLTVEIQTNSGGVPSGTVITNGTSNAVAGTSLSTSYAWIEFTFATPPTITVSTQYHIVVKRSGAVDASNYYRWRVDTSSPDYSSGAFATHNGTSWSSDSGTDGVFEVSDFDVVAGTLKTTITWTNTFDIDLYRVLIYRNTSDNSGTAVPVAIKSARPNLPQQYIDQFDDGSNTFDAGTTYYYWLKFVDRAGNISDFTHSESTAPEGVGGGDLDTTPPTLPGDETITLNDGLTVADDGAYVGHIDASWNAATDDANVTYEIRWKVQGASYQYATSSTTSHRIQGLIPGKTYDINVRAIDAFGNTTAWYNSGTDTSRAISGDAGTPSVISDLTATGGTLKITLEWTDPSEDDCWRSLVYRNTTNDSGTAVPVSIVACKKGAANQYVDQFDNASNPFNPDTTYYYWINVSDRAGNLSGFSNVASASAGNVGTGEATISLGGWTHDLSFTPTDSDIVGWGTGTIRLGNGNSYSIIAGNTGNMTSRTYIYLDTDASTTALQTTTTLATAVGDNKILIGTAVNSTNEALFHIFSGSGGLLVSGSDIEANSVTANELFVSELSAITADMGTLTAGEVRVGTGTVGVDFTGLRLDADGTYHLAGYNSDTLTVGVRASDGHLLAGGGAVIVDDAGLSVDYTGVTGDTTPNLLLLTNSSLTSTKGSVYLADDAKFRVMVQGQGGAFAGLRIQSSDGVSTDDLIQFVAANSTFATITDPIGASGPFMELEGSLYFNSGTLYLLEQAAPTTPSTGLGVIYPKTDGKIYFKNDGGTEFDLTAASGLDTLVVRETPSGAINGSNVTFTLANTPVSGTEEVFLNGVLQDEGAGNDYTISGATITMTAAPQASPGSADTIRVTYWY